MIGTMICDANGFVIETSVSGWTEPVMTISRYRVNVMNGRPRSESERVTFNGSIWSGYGFQCNTGQYAETVEQVEIKRPRGMKVYRDGEWRKR